MENSDVEILLKLDPRTLRVLRYTVVDKPLQDKRREENEKYFKENARFTAESFKKVADSLILEEKRIAEREKLGETKVSPSKFSSKGRIQCCRKFRSQELHELHLKKEGIHYKDKPTNPKGFAEKPQKRESETLNSLTKEQLEELLRLTMEFLAK